MKTTSFRPDEQGVFVQFWRGKYLDYSQFFNRYYLGKSAAENYETIGGGRRAVLQVVGGEL